MRTHKNACCRFSGLRHVSILKLVGTELVDMGGVLELYPINGKNPTSETLAEKLHYWEIRLTSKHLKCSLDTEVWKKLLTAVQIFEATSLKYQLNNVSYCSLSKHTIPIHYFTFLTASMQSETVFLLLAVFVVVCQKHQIALWFRPVPSWVSFSSLAGSWIDQTVPARIIFCRSKMKAGWGVYIFSIRQLPVPVKLLCVLKGCISKLEQLPVWCV